MTTRHNVGGNCLRHSCEDRACDVCHDHDEPRGECSECCSACAAERAKERAVVAAKRREGRT
jgi:hypothetical protein